MKKNQIENASVDELKAKHRSVSALIQVSIVLFVIYISYMVFNLINGNWSLNIASITVLLLFAVVIVPNRSLQKKIKEELKNRNT